ncbi:MAG: hypothetical protein KKA84_03605 [Bacteroidetes bacterium]|nr:hypothetical protein [Bacteroidota bacterium]
MKKIFLLITVAALAATVYSQNINGRFTSSFYTFERFQNENVSETYLRNFNSLLLNVNKGNISLKTRLGLDTDLMNTLDNDPRVRFYNLYLEARNILDIATVKIGRQPFFSSIAGGVYDGASLKLKYAGVAISGFYGGNVPAYQKLEITDDWENDYILGGKIELNAVDNFHLALSYVDKNFKPMEYEAIRMNEDFSPVEILIRQNSNQFKFASAEASYNIKNSFRIFSKAEYDLNFNELSKVQFSGRLEEIENLGISIYYNYREPRVRYNSIFSVFNYGNTQEIEAGLDYKICENMTVVGKFGNVTYEDDDSQRLSLGLNTNYGTVNYRKTFGYSGELDAISIYTAKSYLDGFVTPSIGLSYTSYKLSEDSESNTLMALLGGVNVRPFQAFSFDLQTQYMNNKIYKNDFRILFKINYWFNTNLSLL